MGSSLLWFALPPSSPVSQRPSLRLRLTLPSSTAPMVMVPTLTPTLVSTTDMPDTMLDTLMPTTARGPLMLSQRPMLMPTTTEPMDWDPTVLATEHTDPDTLTLIMDTTTARGPLMLSPPPSQRLMLMPTTATTVMVPGPTTATVWATEDTVWDTEATTGDKFSASEVQSRSSKRTSLLVI